MEEQLQEWMMVLATLKKSYLTETALKNGTLAEHVENLLISMKRVKSNLSKPCRSRGTPLSEENKVMPCEKCSHTGPEGQEHYHIVMTNGKVSAVWYVSASGYWDRELTPDEYFVAYTTES